MNAIELLSAKYNFPVEEAITLFTTKPNKNTKKNAKKEGQSLQDMFAELVNDVEQDNRGPVIETVVVEPAPVDELTKLLMASEKKQALAAMKEQKKFDDLAAKEAAKKQKEEEKLAAKEALKKQKAEEKAALKEPKVKVAKAKKEKADPPAADAAELPPVKVTVTRIKIDDQTYLKSAAGILYNVDTKEEVGLHDEATNTIKPLPDEEEEELEEDEYAEDEYAEDN